MALSDSGMASKIMGDINNITTPEEAINTFYSSLCEYCEENMEVYYTWGATTPPPTSSPDPMVLIKCGVKTAGSISPSFATEPQAALDSFSAALNSQISLWEVVWPSDFTLPPAFILPGIKFSLSGATDRNNAWLHICREIIAGITIAATPGPLSGVHGSFTIPAPGATFNQII